MVDISTRYDTSLRRRDIKLILKQRGVSSVSYTHLVENDDDSLTWTGNEAKFASVTVNSTTLGVKPKDVKFNDDDYEIVYINNTDATSYASKAYVAAIGKGNFKGEYSIVKCEVNHGEDEYDIMLTTDAEKAVRCV